MASMKAVASFEGLPIDHPDALVDVTIDVQWSNEGVRYVSWSDDYDIFNTTDSN